MGNTEKSHGLSGQPPFVSRVGYPPLESHRSHALAKTAAARGLGVQLDLKGSAGQGLCRGAPLRSATWPTWATAAPASTGQHHHFRMADDALAKPVSPRVRSACPSAWKIRMT
jgi:hypothetical protein